MRLLCIRHGDKAPGMFLSSILMQNDQPLSPFGRLQAEALSYVLDEIEADHVYVSQFSRTLETIGPYIMKKQLEPIVSPLIDEIDPGEVGLLSLEQLKKKNPKCYEDIIAHDHDFTYPGGESGEDVFERIRKFIDLITDASHDTVIMVSHEGYISLLMCYLLDLPPYERFHFMVDTAGITEWYYDAPTDLWFLHGFNQEYATARIGEPSE